MFYVVILTITPELTSNEFETLLHLVPLEKQERIKQFHFFRDARNCLLGDIIARVEICRTTGFSNKQIEFTTNDYGKPFLINDPHIYFNISHAGNYVVCAMSDELVGIDIELIKTADMQLAERFFTPDETAYITKGNEVYRFYEVWTKKESYIKLDGKGLYTPLTSFSVFGSSEKRITYHKIFQNDEAVCHVCSAKQEIPSVRMMDTTILIQSIIK